MLASQACICLGCQDRAETQLKAEGIVVTMGRPLEGTQNEDVFFGSKYPRLIKHGNGTCVHKTQWFYV